MYIYGIHGYLTPENIKIEKSKMKKLNINFVLHENRKKLRQLKISRHVTHIRKSYFSAYGKK